MIRSTLSHAVIVIVLAAVVANALRVVGGKGAPAMAYSLGAAVAACCLLRRQRPAVRAVVVVGAAAVGAQLGAVNLPGIAGGPFLVFHGMLIGALVAVLGVRSRSSQPAAAGKARSHSARRALVVGAVSIGVAALLAGLVLWAQVTAQRATLADGLELAGMVLVLGLFVTALVVATTIVVGEQNRGD
ncbi:MAG: hypothetical protein U0836_01430 [Pirellulales bacterium]